MKCLHLRVAIYRIEESKIEPIGKIPGICEVHKGAKRLSLAQVRAPTPATRASACPSC